MKEPNILDLTFDRLSSIPYLKMRLIFKGLWVFSTMLFGFAILVEGIAIFNEQLELRPEWIKNLLLWTGVNPFFAYVLYLWNKREQETRDSSKSRN